MKKEGVNNNNRGSMAVEAALGFPVFFFAIMALCCLFLYMEGEYESRKELARQAEVVSLCRVEAEPVLWALQVEGDDFVLGDEYRLEVPFAMFRSLGMRTELSQRFRFYSGHKVDKQTNEGVAEEGQVYITESGSVFHMSMSCPSLKISIKGLSYSQVAGARNLGGCKYSPCDRCAKGSPPDLVYLTDEGRRYHYRNDCGALKRNVSQLSVKEAEEKGRRACKRCCQKSEG